ncbi:MAG: serine hydrolase, partial [Gemmatimonadales bacterium]
HDERYKRITARMVLSHGTGLPNWGGEQLMLRFDPGTAYGYSGEGFVFLQKVLEHVTGRSLDELARREVFQPLGMKRSSFVWQKRFAGDAAYAKDWLWNVAPVNRYTEAEANAAASLLTTATDYAQFVAAVLTGRGLSPGMWREFLTPVRETSPGISIGLGLRVEEGPTGRVFYHSGNNGRRFTCYMTGNIDQGIGFVYFASAYNGTSLVEALAAPVFGDAHPARNLATFDRYDDPRLVALRSVEHAAVDVGAGAARERLRAIRADTAARPFLDGTLELGAFLAGRGLAPLAIEMLDSAVADAPDSAGAHLALGRALEAAGDLPSAIESYRRGLTLDADTVEAQRQIRWTEERVAARAQPVAIPRRILERYVGQYQERAITLRDGRLFYGGGPSPESPLTAMAEDLFEVAADPTIRVRFVGEGVAPAAKLIGLYSDGSIDEWARSSIRP